MYFHKSLTSLYFLPFSKNTLWGFILFQTSGIFYDSIALLRSVWDNSRSPISSKTYFFHFLFSDFNTPCICNTHPHSMNELAKTGIKFNTLEEICMRAKNVGKKYIHTMQEFPAGHFLKQFQHTNMSKNNKVNFHAFNELKHKSCIETKQN